MNTNKWKSQFEKATFYMIPILQYSGKGNYGNSEEMRGCQHLWREENEAILYDTIMVDTCHYTRPKTHRICNTKSKP